MLGGRVNNDDGGLQSSSVYILRLHFPLDDKLGPNDGTLTCILSHTEWSTSSRRSSHIPSCKMWSTGTIQR